MDIGKEARYKMFLKDVEKWKNKFTDPLTMEQAVEVVLDERKFDHHTGEFSDFNLKDVCGGREWQEFALYAKYDKLDSEYSE